MVIRGDLPQEALDKRGVDLPGRARHGRRRSPDVDRTRRDAVPTPDRPGSDDCPDPYGQGENADVGSASRGRPGRVPGQHHRGHGACGCDDLRGRADRRRPPGCAARPPRRDPGVVGPLPGLVTGCPLAPAGHRPAHRGADRRQRRGVQSPRPDQTRGAAARPDLPVPRLHPPRRIHRHRPHPPLVQTGQNRGIQPRRAVPTPPPGQDPPAWTVRTRGGGTDFDMHWTSPSAPPGPPPHAYHRRD